jgi:hypothetical protein
MITKKNALIISDLFYTLDTSVRNDLYQNRIADERDYVSRLVTHFNYPFGIFNKFYFNQIKFQSKWFSKVNSSDNERKFGCDSMIVFKVDKKLKVGLFEAKWPRIIKDPNYQWDYAQKKNKESHFTNQIIRQSNWTNHAAIWEMFFYEEKVGTLNNPFDKNASTCIRHSHANSLVSSMPSLQTIWNNNDLISLIQSAQSTSSSISEETNIKQIIFDILTCKFGKPIDIKPSNRNFTLTSNNKSEIVNCPIISITEDDNDSNQIIETFMSENGLSFFQQINIETLNNVKE